MFCMKCGNEIDAEALICPKCGCATLRYTNLTEKREEDEPDNPENNVMHLIGLGVCGALLGPISIIVYFIYRKKEPKQANAVILGMAIWIALVLQAYL